MKKATTICDIKKKESEKDMKQYIYMDHAATTPLDPRVLEAMMPFLQEEYANPAAVYSFSGTARKSIDAARSAIADLIGAKKEEVFFTGGGTESDNWVLKAVTESLKTKGKHVITTAIEHHAVLHTAKWLEMQGFDVTYLPVDEEGLVSPESLKRAIRPDTILISIMAANNEVGTIEPMEAIGEIAHENHILFHADAVQAFGHIPMDVEKMHIDFLSASAHKLNGPKGVGMLYVRKNLLLPPFLHGGEQERGRRAGTLNVPGIVGFGEAAKLAKENMEERGRVQRALRDYLMERVLLEIPHARLYGAKENRLPGHACFGFRYCEGEALVLMLDQAGICASSGSACTSGSNDPSHVLEAMGVPKEQRGELLRFSLSENNTREEVDFTVEYLKEAVKKLRAMTPEYDRMMRIRG